MIRCNRWLCMLGLAGLGWPLAAQGALSDAEEQALIPEAPAGCLLDEDGLLDRHPERRDAIVERLRAFEQEHGFAVYVAVYGSIIGSDLPRRARLHFDQWIGPDRDGIVVALETDTLSWEVVTPGTHYARPAPGSASQSRLPDHRMLPILAELRVTLEGVENRVDFLDRTTEILAERVGEFLRAEPAAKGSGLMWRFAAVLLGLGVVIVLAGVFVGRRLRFAEERARERFYFPEVMVGTRLGAPFGGGRQSVVDFSRNRAARP